MFFRGVRGVFEKYNHISNTFWNVVNASTRGPQDFQLLKEF